MGRLYWFKPSWPIADAWRYKFYSLKFSEVCRQKRCIIFKLTDIDSSCGNTHSTAGFAKSFIVFYHIMSWITKSFQISQGRSGTIASHDIYNARICSSEGIEWSHKVFHKPHHLLLVFLHFVEVAHSLNASLWHWGRMKEFDNKILDDFHLFSFLLSYHLSSIKLKTMY